MHYAVLAIVPAEDAEDIESAIEQVLEPYQNREWDWYQIGGRWTGSLDGYDPEMDAANQELCRVCGGTGDNPNLEPPEWKEKCGGCNGCGGKGWATKWPTDWKHHEGDVMPVRELTAEQLEKFYAVVVSDYGWFAKQRFEFYPWRDGDSKWVEQEMPPLDWLVKEFGDEFIAVVVDCHN